MGWEPRCCHGQKPLTASCLFFVSCFSSNRTLLRVIYMQVSFTVCLSMLGTPCGCNCAGMETSVKRRKRQDVQCTAMSTPCNTVWLRNDCACHHFAVDCESLRSASPIFISPAFCLWDAPGPANRLTLLMYCQNKSSRCVSGRLIPHGDVSFRRGFSIHSPHLEVSVKRCPQVKFQRRIGVIV